MSTGTVLPVPIQVNIIKQNIGGQDRAFVLPPEIHVGIGATKVPSVQLRNGTGGRVWLWFPNGENVFDPPAAGFSNPTQIQDGGVLTLNVTARPNPGGYHYHLYCEAVDDCAQGNSEPKVGCP